MSDGFCDESSFLDGALVKIVNKKARVVSYMNCTNDKNISVYARFTLVSRVARDPKELNRIRACDHTTLHRQDEEEEVSSAAAAAADGADVAAGRTRRVITITAAMVVPPATTWPFVAFDMLDDILHSHEHYTPEPCPLDQRKVVFEGGRRRADGVCVDGPDPSVMPRRDAIYACLTNPRDTSGTTNWLYRLVANDQSPPLSAPGDANRREPKTHAQTWAFYNDSVYSVAKVEATFHLRPHESATPCGDTHANSGETTADGKVVRTLTLSVAPLTTALFAHVKCRRPLRVDPANPEEVLAGNADEAEESIRTTQPASEAALIEYDLDEDVAAGEGAADDKTVRHPQQVTIQRSELAVAHTSADTFVVFAFATTPYRSVEPLGVDALYDITWPRDVVYDQVFPCPRTTVTPEGTTRAVAGAGDDTVVAAVTTPRAPPAARQGPLPRSPNRDSAEYPPRSTARSLFASQPYPQQRRLSATAREKAPTASASASAPSDVFLLVDSEAAAWHLFNRSQTLSYQVFVTVYGVASVEEWNTEYAVVPPPHAHGNPDATHVRKARSQRGAVVVEVTLAPAGLIPLCQRHIPASFDLACVVVDANRFRTFHGRSSGSSDSRPDSGRHAERRSSSLLQMSTSAHYLSLQMNSLLLETPTTANVDPPAACEAQQVRLPDQEKLEKDAVVFVGPGPDEKAFPYTSLYAVFPRVIGSVPTVPAAPMRVAPPSNSPSPVDFVLPKLMSATASAHNGEGTPKSVSTVTATHLGTNGVLFRLVNTEGTQWGLYNDTADLNVFVHAIFTMEQNAFGRPLAASQKLLGRTRAVITPWQQQQQQRQSRMSSLSGRHPSPSLNSSTSPRANVSLPQLATPKDGPLTELSTADLGATGNTRKPRPPHLAGLPTPSDVGLTSRGSHEAGHIAHRLFHAVVLVPPHTTVPFLQAETSGSLDGCVFQSWVEPVPLAAPTFAHAEALKAACTHEGFHCDEVFAVCCDTQANGTLFKLVDSPLIRLAQQGQPRQGNAAAGKEAEVCTLDDDSAATLTRSRWAFFNDSDSRCFTVTLTFSPQARVAAGTTNVFADSPDDVGAEWNVVSRSVTGIVDNDGGVVVGGADTASATNRLRIANKYASADFTSALPLGSSSPSVPASPQPEVTPGGGTTVLRTTVWPGEMVVLLEAAPDTNADLCRVRTDRAPHNRAITFESANPIIYRSVDDYEAHKKASAEPPVATAGTDAPAAESAAALGSPVDHGLHVDDMLSKHYLRFYRDYREAPVYRIVNDREKLWSVYNDDSTATFKVRVVFRGASRVRPLGAARDETNLARQHAKLAQLGIAKAAEQPRRSAHDQQGNGQSTLTTKKEAAKNAKDYATQLLHDDPNATVVDVTVRPSETELLVAADDVQGYVVFLEKQPHKRTSRRLGSK